MTVTPSLTHPHLERLDRAIDALREERRRLADVVPVVAFQGAPGAFSEAAARVLVGGAPTLAPRRTLDDVFADLAAGRVDFAVIPVENTLAGRVPRASELIRAHHARVIATHALPVSHALIGCRGASLDAIRTVASHPMALAQCRRLLAEHPAWAVEEAFDTAGAVETIVANGDPSRAALASVRAAEHYGGVVLAADVQDRAENLTTFVLVRT